MSKYDPFLSQEGVVARTIMFADALDGAWTAALLRDRSASIVVMEGVLEYFTKDQTAACLHMLCDSFEHGYLVAEMNSMFIVKHSKQHDAIKNTNATFKWGTESGAEFVELEPRMELLSERSYNEEMRKHTLRGRLFATTVGKNVNNRIAVFRW
ncbi:hypothetical protein [Olsenella urininfantis]|uniref:hypothetical protein n=1 Tax=Olsenella urininfantis TaxID=1871033 RepID=UPI001F29E3B7|nr:hypothetical protein [Olsenella urininfantis]